MALWERHQRITFTSYAAGAEKLRAELGSNSAGHLTARKPGAVIPAGETGSRSSSISSEVSCPIPIRSLLRQRKYSPVILRRSQTRHKTHALANLHLYRDSRQQRRRRQHRNRS